MQGYARSAAAIRAAGDAQRQDPSRRKGRDRMFRYFENSQMLSQGVLLALNSGGEINEIARAGGEVSIANGIPEIGSWFDAWTRLAGVLVDQAEADLAKGREPSAA